MEIRCKRCFRKYNDSDIEWPRSDMGNDGYFDKSEKKYVRNDKHITEWINMLICKTVTSFNLKLAVPKIIKSTRDTDTIKYDRNNEKLFVRIDTKVIGEELTENDFEKHKLYLDKLSSERYCKGGDFKVSTGMIIFSASSYEEADFIAKNDPVIASGKFSYQLEEWEVIKKSNR